MTNGKAGIWRIAVFSDKSGKDAVESEILSRKEKAMNIKKSGYYAKIKEAQNAVRTFPIPHQLFNYKRNETVKFLPIDFFEEIEINEIRLCLVNPEFSDYPKTESGGQSGNSNAFGAEIRVKGEDVYVCPIGFDLKLEFFL